MGSILRLEMGKLLQRWIAETCGFMLPAWISAQSWTLTHVQMYDLLVL